MDSLLYLTKKNATNEPGSICHTIDSTLRDEEGSTSWRASWEHWETTNVSRSSHCGWKGKEEGIHNHLGPISNMSGLQRSQLAIRWDEAFCAQYDKLSNGDVTYVCTAQEHKRRENSWPLILNSQGRHGPIKQREDHTNAIKTNKRLHKKSGAASPKIHPSKQVRLTFNTPFSRSSEGAERVESKTGWKWYPPTSHQAHFRHGGKWWQASSLDEKWFLMKIPISKCFAFRQWRFLCKRCGVWTLHLNDVFTKCNVNLSNSQDGSSSCQCTTTLYGEKKETKKYVLRIPWLWLEVQEDSRTVIGRFLALDQKRSGTEHIRTNRMESGMMSLNTCCSSLAQAEIPYWVDPVVWKEENLKSKWKGKMSIFSVVKTTQPNWFFAQPFRQPAQYLRSNSGHVRRIGLQNLRLTCCSEQFRDHGDANRIVTNKKASDQWQNARKHAARPRTKIRNSSRSSSIDHTVLQCRYHENRDEGTVFHDPRRFGTGQIRWLKLRVFFISRQRSI